MVSTWKNCSSKRWELTFLACQVAGVVDDGGLGFVFNELLLKR
jgi:hypothetical protein